VIRRSVFLVSAFVTLSTHTSAATFDRQAFLAAVKERFKSEPALMELRSPYDPILRVESYTAKTKGWQKDVMTIPAMSLPATGLNASFGIALAYLASEELRIPFSSGRGNALLVVDDGVLYHRPATITIGGSFTNFADILLRTVFDERSSCSIQTPVFRGTPAESDFAKSICRDLKQVVADARNEFKDQRLLASEKENARTAIQRAQDLLKQVPRYGNAPLVEASITSLAASIEGNDLNEIRSKEQALVNGSRDVEQNVATQHASADALASARQAANRELTRTQNLLPQASGYSKREQVVSVQRSLENSVAGDDTEDIKAKTQALVAANRELDQFIGQQRSAATTRPVAQSSSASDGDWFMAGIFLLVVVGFGFFSIPTLVAFSRRHRNRWAILVLNLVFGATLIGWVIALIWALNKVDDPVKGGVKLGPAPPDPIL
jgi:hypothetical protein